MERDTSCCSIVIDASSGLVTYCRRTGRCGGTIPRAGSYRINGHDLITRLILCVTWNYYFILTNSCFGFRIILQLNCYTSIVVDDYFVFKYHVHYTVSTLVLLYYYIYYVIATR